MKLNWRQGTFYATTIGMEGCWLYALLVLLNNQVTDGRLSIFGLLLLYPLAFGLNGLLLWLGWHRVYRDIINVLACGIAILLILKAQLFSGLALSDTTWLLALPRAIANIFYAFAPELLILVSGAVREVRAARLSGLSYPGPQPNSSERDLARSSGRALNTVPCTAAFQARRGSASTERHRR